MNPEVGKNAVIILKAASEILRGLEKDGDDYLSARNALSQAVLRIENSLDLEAMREAPRRGPIRIGSRSNRRPIIPRPRSKLRKCACGPTEECPECSPSGSTQ